MNTMEFYKINKVLECGEEIEIETTIGEKHLYGRKGNAEWENYFKYRDFNSSWLQIDIGDNVFQYEADDGVEDMQMSITFSQGYLEVEECY